MIKKWGSKNPVILLDELEKVEDKEIQKHLIQLFKDYKERGHLFKNLVAQYVQRYI